MSSITLAEGLAMAERCERARRRGKISGENERPDIGKVSTPAGTDSADVVRLAREIRSSPSIEREADLHEQIEGQCRLMGYFYVHARMDRPTTVGIGVPDFVIALPSGKTLWIECKAKSKKLTTEQAAAQAWLRKAGHVAETVWTFSEFMAIVDQNT